VKVSGVYHTDFTSQTNRIINDEQLESLVEAGIKWFYSAMDEIKVPTFEYVKILKERGYDHSRMSIFRRGIDTGAFSYRAYSRPEFNAKYGIKNGVTLLYTGRVSKDKNLDFLLDVYRELITTGRCLNLVIAGDGPYMKELKESAFGLAGIIFTGRQNAAAMPDIYSAADVLLFPSTTDTFGMSVLEAQACGLPAIVSEAGGPKEIIIEGRTGFIANSASKAEWKRAVEYMINMIELSPCRYEEMRGQCRQNAVQNFNWKEIISSLTDFHPFSSKRRIKTA
jgi:glycosyltransferase involved in cell wall biosynthesis